MSEKITITKKEPIYDNSEYRALTIRIPNNTFETISVVSESTNRSRNELINILLAYALENITIED